VKQAGVCVVRTVRGSGWVLSSKRGTHLLPQTVLTTAKSEKQMSLRRAVTFLAAAGLYAAPPGRLPTFNKDIAPILYKNCATCHRPGEVAPFALLTYSDAKHWAPMIAQAASNHVMPPQLLSGPAGRRAANPNR